jgi:hypothetical protein
MRARLLSAVVLVLLSLTALARAADTLWIFDADFEDMTGDNAGWFSEDRSGTLPVTNYWHKDTIRSGGFEWLGDSTWWCGTVNPCWRQPRGYGNSWVCSLERTFLEVEVLSTPGDTLTLEWDQRIAMEKDYDYGYVDLSVDGGKTWTTEHQVTDPGFPDKPGYSKDWDDPVYGHVVLELDDYAGAIVDLRFRFESDGAYSSQDQYDNPPLHSVRDGAWQLDNIEWKVNGSTIWLDDCESPGDNGWAHEDVPGSGQTGIVWQRRYESFAGRSGWMMSAYDGGGTTADHEHTVLWGPPVNVLGAPELVGNWQAWLDIPGCSDGIVELWQYLSVSDACNDAEIVPVEPVWGPHFGGPQWVDASQQLLPGDEERIWLWPMWRLSFDEADSVACHSVGFALDRYRVGVVLETGVPDESAAGGLTIHPNPCNPRATIGYSVPAVGHLNLAVYDLAGRLVATLVDDECEPGCHEATWDGTTDAGSRAASGVYFVRLATETTEATERLVLLK